MSGRVQDFRLPPERVAALPAHDRIEIVGQAIAFSSGSRIKDSHPLAFDLARNERVCTADIMAALGRPDDVRGAFTSSDLGAAVTQALKLIVLDVRRERGIPEHRAIVSPTELPSFEDYATPRHHPLALPEVIGELREIPTMPAALGWAGLKVKTFGGILGFSRQAIINADWPLLRSLAFELTDAALRAERAEVIRVLTDNAALDDGLELFHADRGNLITGEGVGNVTSLSSMFRALRMMEAVPGTLAGPLNISGTIIALPAGDEIEASILEIAGALELRIIADAALTDWYLLPNPALRPVIALAHLGALEPVIDMQQSFDSEAWGVRVRHDIGASAVSPFAVRAVA